MFFLAYSDSVFLFQSVKNIMGSLLFLLKVSLSSASFVLVFIFFLLDLRFLFAGEEGSIVERFEGISNLWSWILHAYVALKDL